MFINKWTDKLINDNILKISRISDHIHIFKATMAKPSRRVIVLASLCIFICSTVTSKLLQVDKKFIVKAWVTICIIKVYT